MAASFDQVVADIASGARSFASVATHLVTLVEEVHNRKLLVVDIKPDNFMIAPSGNIVMIDLGLVQSYGSMGGHRPNNTARTSGVVGTPLCASLHLFQGETPSRRDDLEALVYLFIEVVLKSNKTSKGSKQLPWSDGRSEHEIGALKKQCMTDESAPLWKTLGPVAAASLRSFFEQVHNLGYSKKPDYDALRQLVQVIELGGKKKKGATKIKASATSRAGTARAIRTQTTASAAVTIGRSSANSRRAIGTSEAPTNVDGTTKKRPSHNMQSGRKSKKVEVVDEYDDDDGFYTVQNMDEDDFHSCNSDDAMDWELVKDAIGVTLEIVSGPHEGEMISLIQGQRETVVFGLRPDVVDGYDLAGDSDVDLAHAQVTLQVTKKLATVVVKDLKSSAGTLVGKHFLQSGTSQKAFLNDMITIGETGIKVLPLKSPVASMGSAGRFKIINFPDVDMQVLIEKENSKPPERGLKLTLVEGPANTPFMHLLPGETKIVGSKGDFVVKGADPSHLKLTLHVTRQVMAVQVKDLRSKTGTFINGNKVQEGKLFIGDLLKVGDCTWKVTRDDGDLKQSGTNTANAVESATARGFRLEFTAGPYKGEQLVLQDSHVESIVLGANPRPRSGTAFKLDNDPSISDSSHVRIELDSAMPNQTGKCNSLSVTDLKSATGIRLNGNPIGKGKKMTAFMNDSIVVGASTIRIKPL